jgi:cephalosporin-C deacetylase-like acetyl esterase
MKATARFLGGLLLFALAQDVAAAQSKPEEVVFPSDGRELHGFLWKPRGPGPFRAIMWNHGSEKLPGSQPALASFYTAHSYVFFVPHRRGQGRSPGETSRIWSLKRPWVSVPGVWSNSNKPRLTMCLPP